MPGTLIALSSVATAGKDTFHSLLTTHLSNRVVTRMAFADRLKTELDPLFKAFGGSAFTTDPVQKALIRPVLVSHGCSMRVINPRHWIDAIAPDVQAALARNETVVVTDVRFQNEANWIKSLGGNVIYIERIKPDGSVVGPANEEEARNDPYLRANADVFLSWETRPAAELWGYVEKAAKDLGLNG